MDAVGQWAGVSALVGVIGLLVVILTHIVKYAVQYGAMQERIRRLEDDMKQHKDVSDAVITLRGTVNALGVTVDEFKTFMREFFQSPVPPYRPKRRAQND